MPLETDEQIAARKERERRLKQAWRQFNFARRRRLIHRVSRTTTTPMPTH
jgi:hypothetical protein